MPPQDQLEIITPFGQIWFYTLADFGRAALNIGRHPDNDVVVNGPSVDEHHAVLDISQKPYRIVFLSSAGDTTLRGQRVRPNNNYTLQNLDTIQMDGFQLVLLVDTADAPMTPGEIYTAPVSRPATIPTRPTAEIYSATSVDPDLPDELDDFITIDYPAHPAGKPEFRVNPGVEVRFALRIKNTGERVAEFMVSLAGIDPNWVQIFYPGKVADRVNLLVDQEKQVNVIITPPGEVDNLARAGKYPFMVEVRSPTPTYETRVSHLSATLIVNRVPKFTVESSLEPPERTLSWFQRETVTQMLVTNQGNSEAMLRLSGQDDKGNCNLKFWTPGEAKPRPSPVELTLRHPGETIQVPILVEPRSRFILPWNRRTYFLDITAAMVDAEQRLTVSGRLKHKPLLNWFVFLLLGLMSLYLCMFAYYPRIWSFRFDNLAVTERNTTVKGGTPVSLNWSVWPPFAGVKIQPELGEMPSVNGTATVMPLAKVEYQLQAENALSQLLPLPPAFFFSSLSRNLTVNVDAGEPHVLEFLSDRSQIDQGDTVRLYWRVENAEAIKLINLATNEEHDVLNKSDFSEALQQTTSYRLSVTNRFFDKAEERNLEIKVLPPLPIVVAFDVSPAMVNEGDRINLAWQITGADTVFIDPLGQQASNGQTFEIAAAGLYLKEYTLRAAKAGREIEPITKRVNIIAATPTPTVTPTPTGTLTPTPAATPEIVYFNLSKNNVILGGERDEDDNGQVIASWSVRGDTTNIEVVGSANFGPISNLDQTGVLPVPADKPSSFVLTAYNGETAKNSQTVLLNVETATPTPIPPTPAPPPPTPTATPIGATISYFRAESGDEPPNPILVQQTGANSYEVTVLNRLGTKVKLLWSVNNADKVKLQIQGGADLGEQPLIGTLIVAINKETTYMLIPVNKEGNPNQATPAQVVLKVKSNVPPPPYSVSGNFSTNENTLRWQYRVADEGNILGYRIYRNDNTADPNQDFQIIATEDAVRPTDRSWTDSTTPTCGRGYYIVAVYYDAQDEVTRETSFSSDTSWYSDPCGN